MEKRQKCPDCGKLICNVSVKCDSCCKKGKKRKPFTEEHKLKLSKTNQKDGRSLKNYYCECGKEITWQTGVYGSGKCGSCSSKMRKISKETKLKISKALKGRKFSEDFGKKISKALKGRKLTKETKEKISKVQKGKIVPKKTREKMSKRHKGCKISEETKEKISKSHKGKSLKELGHILGCSCAFCKAKRGEYFAKIIPIKYKNICMRSSWEVKYAKYLDENNIKWQYEPKRFYVNKIKAYYIPDFYLPEKDEYIEIKGYWRKTAKKKFNAFKNQYQNIKIKILQRIELEKLGIIF